MTPKFKKYLHWLKFRLQSLKATPVFIFTMGKVASQSVHFSVKQEYLGPVTAGHSFTPEHERLAVSFLYRYYKTEKRPIKIISLLREPIGRNVSAFFQNFERDVGVAYNKHTLSIDDLKKRFLDHYRHDIPLVWFDEKMKKEFGIDVFEKTFSKAGHQCFSKNNVELLLMRHDLDNAVKEQEIKKLLQLNTFTLKDENIGNNKEYAATYQAFKQEAKLPKWYLDKMQNSKYFQHFYTATEINQVVKKWR